ncbi:DUF4010 domain-containing protein [Ramlibacter sp. AN1015]|uniref:MgtC/SapB family protein n=1 Tax=Ramlibacter sp. AN1015 TaxID=3133428 RepID=UPI0030C11B5F
MHGVMMLGRAAVSHLRQLKRTARPQSENCPFRKGRVDVDGMNLAQGAQALGSALAVGLLVGLERGWRDRELPEGGRVAGLRTFALIGLAGGLLALVPAPSGLLLAAGALGVVLLFAVAFRRASQATGTLSITSAVAGLATYGLGALAATGHAILAVGTAVIVALLLDLKPLLHRWLRLIQPAELNALLQLGVLTAVVLPLLPDAGYGPYRALNPFKLWMAVILIAGLSLLGHVAARLKGEQQGLLWTGLLGGLASSTAATLALARTARAQPDLRAAAAAAIVAACGVMFLRMAIVATVLQPSLAGGMGVFLVLLAAAGFLFAAWQWRRRPAAGTASVPARDRLFDLPVALGFGLVLAVVAVLVRAARDALGTAGIYGVAFVSGLADVDAILVSSVQMLAQGELSAWTTAVAILLAASANMVSKAAIAWSIAGRGVGVRVAGGFLFISAAGLAAAAIQAR